MISVITHLRILLLLKNIYIYFSAKSIMDEDELEKFEVTRDSMTAKSNLKGDWLNFFLLILLYTMQGLSLGMAITFPIIFQTKKISYGEQVNYYCIFKIIQLFVEFIFDMCIYIFKYI